MSPKFFLKVVSVDNASIECLLTEDVPQTGFDSLELILSDASMIDVLQQADQQLKDLLSLVATQAYNLGYSQSEFAPVKVNSSAFSFGSKPLIPFSELCRRFRATLPVISSEQTDQNS